MMVKQNFQQLLFQSSVSYNPSEIILICWFGAQKTAAYFYFFSGFSTIYLKYIFCNNVKVLTAICDQLNASLLNRSIIFFF